MRTATPSRKTLALAIATPTLEAALVAADLRLRPSDKRRQPVDIATVRNCRLRLWLRLKLLPTVFAMTAMFAGLVLLALLVWLPLALVIACIVVAVVARDEWLRLHRNKARLLPEM